MGGGPATPSDVDSFDDRSVGPQPSPLDWELHRPAATDSEFAIARAVQSEDAVEVSHKPTARPAQDPLGARAYEGGSTWGERASSYDGDEETGEPERARLLYSKSKVYLHPTSYLRDNIPGFISIVQLGTSTDYLLAWIPEASIEGTPDYESYVLVELSSDAEQTTLVTPPPPSSAHAFSIPIRTLYSVQIQPPTLSAWFGSVTFSLYGGDVFPPLYFHDEESRSTVLDRDRRAAALGALGADRREGGNGAGIKVPPSWGGEALLGQLRQYAQIVRSQIEPSLFLVNPSRTDLEVHSTALFEDEAVPTEAMQGMRLRNGDAQPMTARERSQREGKRNSILHQSLDAQDYPDEVGPGMDNFTFNVLNSFSRITRGARTAAQTAAQSVLSHPLAKPILKNIPEPIAQFATAPGELTRLQETAGVGAYDAARVYLAKWARVVAEEGERARRAEVVISGPGGRAEDTEVGAFEVLSSTYKITRPKSSRASATPIVDTEWAAWFDDHGKLMLTEDEAKKRIFQRGLAHDVRRDVWPFLLNVFPWDSNTEERKGLRKEKTAIYESLKAKWANDEELQKTDRYAEESHRVEIDCRRTDRTHPMFASDDEDFNQADSPHPPSNAHVKSTQEILLSYVFTTDSRDYVQGMSDLLSPIYVVCEGDQVMAYWAFETLMERMKGNFLRDQSGMKGQLTLLQGLLRTMDVQLYKHLEECGSLNLFMCFRWLLCSFKRELSFDQTLQLWEVLWTDYLGTNFHLFIALAILEAHRDVIIRYLREFDEVLKYTTQLSQTLDIEAIMADAEVLFVTFRQVVEASDRQRAAAASSSDPEKGGMRRRKLAVEKEPEEEEGAAYPPSKGKGKQVDGLEKEVVEVVVEKDVPEVDEELRVLLS